MSYSAGLGSGKGWHALKSILTPSEFQNLFNDLSFSFVVTNGRVDIDYKQTDKSLIFINYEKLYSRIFSGIAWDKKEDWKLESNIRISITDDIEKIVFKEFTIKEKEGFNKYKLVRPSEPVLNLSPFFLSISNDRLSLETFNAIGILGIELSYPKVISWDHEDHKYLHDTSNFKCKSLYDNIVSQIKIISCKPKIVSAKKIFKPNFWISKRSLIEVNNNFYLKTNGFKIS